MKVASGKSDNKKRKRDELKEAISESPKKAKVHAQRKFAQGAAFNNSVITPIKDKFRPSTAAQSSGPMLTTKCPNTEDFLTFLCFRRTSILPPKLDFFKEARGTDNNAAALSKLNIDKNCEYNLSKKQIIKKNIQNDIKKKLPPATMQALRKKYQEQRLAKQKVTNVTKLAQKVKGKNMVRTRSSVIVEDIKPTSKTRVSNKENSTGLTGLRSGLKRIQPTLIRPIKKVVKPKHLRMGLRSSTLNIKSGGKMMSGPKFARVINNKKVDKDVKKSNIEISQIKTKNVKLQKTEGFSDFSSDDNEPLLAVTKAKIIPKKASKMQTESLLEKKEEIKSFVKTRSQVVEPEAFRIVRPTRKTKEAAALYVEMISKKLVSPEKSGDDDVSSVDSFPELPNAKKNEQRESEIKAKALANQKPVSKEKEKDSESKKLPLKKSEVSKSTINSSKQDCKNNKRTFQVTKKETSSNDKQNISPVPAKKSFRNSAKNKQCDEKDEKDEQSLLSRPSTRSRYQEEVDYGATSKLPVRTTINKVSKVVINKENSKNEKPAPPNKIEKIKAKNNTCKTVLKEDLVNQDKDFKVFSVEKEENQDKIKERFNNDGVKNIFEEKKEIGKEENTSKGKKISSEKKAESKITTEEKMEKKEQKSESTLSKRPTRKCTAADKLCFEVDVFTSDEDDLSAFKITSNKLSTKKSGINVDKEKRKKEEEKKSNVAKRNKSASKKDKTLKKDIKTNEEKKKKDENKSFKKINSTKAKFESKHQKENLINVENTKKECVMQKKNEVVSLSTKRTNDIVTENKDNEQKNELEASKIESNNYDSNTSEVKMAEDFNIHQKTDKKENLLNLPVEIKESSLEKEIKKDSKSNEKETGSKKEEKKRSSLKINKKSKENVKNLRDPEFLAENESTDKEMTNYRTRPIRQCSKGQKKWVETDSDSFSFYETSDEDDGSNKTFELNFTKYKEKSSLVTKNSKNDKKSILESDQLSTKNKSEDNSKKNQSKDYKKNENFSDSDEEPLKKKAEVVNRTFTKSSHETESVAELNATKVQKDLPELHPLKKVPNETAVAFNVSFSKPPQNPLSVSPQVTSALSYTGGLLHQSKPVLSKSKKLNTSTIRSFPGVAKEDQVFNRPNHLLVDRNSASVSVPDRIEMILHSLKKDAVQPEKPNSKSNEVKVTFENVAYHSLVHSSQVASNSCGYQIKPVIKIPPPREPISTHGLDLLSEVALPTTPKNKLNSQTERIEKWLKDSLAAEHKKSFMAEDDNLEYKASDRDIVKKTNQEKSEVGFFWGKSWPPVNLSSHSEMQKFGQAELTASQKLLKKNLFVSDVSGKVEHQQPSTAKKAVITSVQDLLKLQKEKKETTKLSPETSKHLKNCKCNNCVVKKGWFKNKPVPKMNEPKSSSSTADERDITSKPFESLTRAFKVDQPVNKVIAKGKNSKMSVSVAPILVNSSPFESKVATSTSTSTSASSCQSQSTSTSPGKSFNEKKGIFQQRKMSFLERMKERERKESALSKASPNAFSANNESSVYAFEPECEVKEIANSSGLIKNRTSTTSKSDDESLKTGEDESPATASLGTQIEKLPKDDDKTIYKSSQSASIAVQVNLDSESIEVEATSEIQDGKSIEISTQTEVPEEDSDSPMFYIPLQQSTTPEQQLIQGVALKLGTEGPKGPNQRVVMKAKLVTKPPDGASIKAVVMPQPKRIFDQKSSKPPIGTVQPTTRKPPEEPKNIDTAVETVLSSKEPSYSANITSQTSAPPSPKSPATIFKASEPLTQTKSFTKGKEKLKENGGSKEKPEAKGNDECLPSSSTTVSKTKKSSKHKAAETTVNSTSSTRPPSAGSTSKMVEAPTFYATEKDFQDPFEFFEKIRPAAENFGLCRIVPPSNFKPDCKVSDDMRFTAYNQYVHRMFHRWGPNIKEMMAIKKYLATQSISLKQPPWIGGIEVDLPRLYQSVQNCGGLMKVMEKKKWHQVADIMRIPKAAQDRVTKLDDIYCKYLLPYDTLSHDERQKLFDEVEEDWKERQKSLPDSQGEDDGDEDNYIEECEECVVRGRNMALNQFYRIARNTMTMWFRNADPSPREVENEFWKHVSDRNHHVCVHSGSIDSSGWGYGFPIAKNNSFSKHPWNLKVLTNNSRSVLRSLGPAMGVTVPTLHVGMVFTAFCWYRDPHGLPWIEYLHTGAPKIWYGISDDNSNVFHEALKKLLPRYIKNKTIWLPSDTAMMPPSLLVDHGVSLCHTVQEPGQFILVFPRAFISSICTGYMVSESVYFAQLSWLTTAEQAFRDIQESCEPSMFSLEKLLFSIATDSRSSVEVLKQVLPMVWHVRQKEIDGRKTLFNLGLKTSEKLPSREGGSKKKKGRWTQNDEGEYECEVCRMNLFVSLVTNSDEEGTYCLPHAIDLLTQKRHQLKYCKLMYTYSQEEMNDLVEKLEQRIESKSQKKPSTVKASTAPK